MKDIKIVKENRGLAEEVVKRLSQLPENKKLEVVIRDPRRTSRQNRALHKFFTWVAENLNDNNMFLSRELLSSEYEAEWTPEMVKEVIWRPTQVVLTGKASSTKLTTTELTLVADTVQQGLARKGLSIDFPSMELLTLEQYGNDNIR